MNDSMIIDEKFARYILDIQNIAIHEIGESAVDKVYSSKIKSHFPNIRKELEEKEFMDWLWMKVAENHEVKEMKEKIDKSFIRKNSSVPTSLIISYGELKNEVFDRLKYEDKKMREEFKLSKAIEKMQKI
jgi:hypothetical protein